MIAREPDLLEKIILLHIPDSALFFSSVPVPVFIGSLFLL
jgi:hypothetical protein